MTKTQVVLTAEHYDFCLDFVHNCLSLIRRNNEARREALDIYNSFARCGNVINGVRAAIVNLCGVCDYSDNVLKDFAPAIRIHLNQIPQTRKALTAEEKFELMDKCGLRCPKCGKLLFDVNFDHILPFFLVYDTLDMANRQCLCAECNRDKANYIVQACA